MSENFAVRIYNGAFELAAPTDFGFDLSQSRTETTMHQPARLPETDISTAETGMLVITGTFLIGAVTMGVLLNNPQTLKKIDQKLDDRRHRRSDSQQACNSLQ